MFLRTIYLSKHQKQSNANSYSMDHEKFLAIKKRENEKDRKFRKKHSFPMCFFISDLSMHFICWRNIYPLLKNLSCFIRENVTIGRYKTWFLTWNEHVNQNLVKQLFLIQMIPKFYYKEVKIKVYLYYFRNNCLTPLHDKYRMISNLILRFTFTLLTFFV